MGDDDLDLLHDGHYRGMTAGAGGQATLVEREPSVACTSSATSNERKRDHEADDHHERLR
jgi:hypothetical protein